MARYFDDDERFADFINGFVFEGKQVVTEHDISGHDPNVTGIFQKLHHKLAVRKIRDAIRKVVFDTCFILVGLENQDKVHYAMPIRIMFEDAAGYDEQMRAIQKRHRRNKDLTEEGFPGFFSKYDLVYPVVTLALYYGDKPWDGPTELYQMMDFNQIPDQFKPFLNNYKIHVVEIRKLRDPSLFQSDLREVFGFLARAGNKDEILEFTEENKEAFESMEEDAFDVIAALTGSKELEEHKESYREKGGKINMCEGLRGLIEDGKLEGQLQGMQKGKLEKSKTVARNMFLRGMGIEDTAAICEEDPQLIAQWFKQWSKKSSK